MTDHLSQTEESDGCHKTFPLMGNIPTLDCPVDILFVLKGCFRTTDTSVFFFSGNLWQQLSHLLMTKLLQMTKLLP